MKILTGILMATVTALAQGDPPASLVGLWESGEKSRGGIGTALEFKADGTCTQTSTVLVDAYYRVEGDRLFITEKQSVDSHDTKASGAISFKDGKFLMSMGDGRTAAKERVGTAPEGQPPIVGVWRYKHPTGATAFERYTPDGRLSLRISLLSLACRFSLDGDTLALTPEGGSEAHMKVKLNGDEMTMTDAASKYTQWRRVVDGAWYQTT